jgi:CelD/BcsL family acetyltransferase involved in cellulose biosynthesis
VKCETLPAQELGSARLCAWDQLLAQAPIYKNPNLSPWFIMALAPHRPIQVGMVWDQDRLLAVLPFHVVDDDKSEALALGVSDHHGPLFHHNWHLPYLEIYRLLGIKEYRFDNLLAHPQIEGVNWQPSHLINLAKGEAGYRWELRNRGSGLWQKMQRRLCKLEREVGSVTFVPQLQSHELLDMLILWKSRQFRRTHVSDDFDLFWNRPFLHELLETDERSCKGLLSGLFADSKPLALHMGTCSPQVLQTCYTAYDPAYAAYSPGALLSFHKVKYCLEEGIPLIDLGKGDEAYKQRWSNDRLWVAEGRLTF